MKFLNIFKRKYKPILEPASNLGITETQLIARDIILNKVIPIDKTGEINRKITGIDSESDKTVHAIIVSDFSEVTSSSNRLALSLARQIALFSHFPNFDESNGKNHTNITFIDISSISNLNNVFDALKLETKNLFELCHWHIHDSSGSISLNDNAQSYIDIQFNFFNLKLDEISSFIENKISSNNIISIFHNNCPITNLKSNHILQCYNFANTTNVIEPNLKRAQLANMIYQKGINLTEIRDISDINSYNKTLNYYSKNLKWKIINEEWQNLQPELKLSSLFCVDCFESRIRSANYEINDKNITALAYTEHARWNVEKLILGYRPYTIKEKYDDNSNYGETKIRIRKDKKNTEKAHIDICSCNELIRVNKEDIKYDYFLTLCIPHILKREKK